MTLPVKITLIFIIVCLVIVFISNFFVRKDPHSIKATIIGSLFALLFIIGTIIIAILFQFDL